MSTDAQIYYKYVNFICVRNGKLKYDGGATCCVVNSK